MTTANPVDGDCDRIKEVKQFDDSKIGVKGLIDTGINTIPKFFIHPSETFSLFKSTTNSLSSDGIPIIDLSNIDSDRRSIIVNQLREASHEWGFFHVINHGIPCEILDNLISAIKGFNEQPTEIKSQFYHRELGTGVSFSTNVDLFKSKAASWRDTIQMRLGPNPPEFDKVPAIYRKEVVEFDRQVQRFGEILMELLCEGLGLNSKKLKEITCSEGRMMAAHYYPYCPQPDLTFGLTSHTDPGALTVLLQNMISGLQVKHGEDWVDVKPLAGALTINVGDLLQIISNDEYKSVEHRVLANPFEEPRISVAIFFNPSKREDLYGPFPELVSKEKPALYRSFSLNEFMQKYFSKELDVKSVINYFKF